MRRKRVTLDTVGEWWDDLQQRQALRAEHTRQMEEREQVLYRQIKVVPPLPRRAIPKPWEDLASVVARSAHAMGYAHPRWVLLSQKVEYGVRTEALPLLRRELDYELLRRLLNLDEATLHGLTLHRFTVTRKTRCRG